MNKKDPNYIPALEKAVKEKYGDLATQNPKHFWDENKEPQNPVTIPLQQSASNILALPFREIQPRIAFTPGERPIDDKYICISTRSTAQCKHWYYWPQLIQALKDIWNHRE